MRTVSSYGVEIRKQNIPARQTMEIYRQAVGYLTEIYAQVWEELRKIPETKKRFNTAEHMVHMTKKNTARFDFDLRFPKMPSYLRRSAIQHALGSVSSYETRLGQWKETGVLSGRPKLTCRNHAMPVFYRDVMYREGAEGKDEAYLKLYDGHDWKWFRVYLKRTDMEYLPRNWKGKKTSAPALEKRHRRYFLRFSCTEEVTLTKTPVKEQIICSVDLGINTDAVCTIMRSDGTVLGRRFIDHPSEKDRMYRTLGRIRRSQREHGSAQTQGRWAYTKRLNTEMGRKTIVPYGLYRAEGYISANLARKVTGFSEDDLELLWEAILNMFEVDHSAARGNMAVRELIVFKHSKELGDCPAYKLFDAVEVKRNEGVEYPRKYQDYTVTVHEEQIPDSVEVRRMN